MKDIMEKLVNERNKDVFLSKLRLDDDISANEFELPEDWAEEELIPYLPSRANSRASRRKRRKATIKAKRKQRETLGRVYVLEGENAYAKSWRKPVRNDFTRVSQDRASVLEVMKKLEQQRQKGNHRIAEKYVGKPFVDEVAESLKLEELQAQEEENLVKTICVNYLVEKFKQIRMLNQELDNAVEAFLEQYGEDSVLEFMAEAKKIVGVD